MVENFIEEKWIQNIDNVRKILTEMNIRSATLSLMTARILHNIKIDESIIFELKNYLVFSSKHKNDKILRPKTGSYMSEVISHVYSWHSNSVNLIVMLVSPWPL
jgi:hypothetical protein